MAWWERLNSQQQLSRIETKLDRLLSLSTSRQKETLMALEAIKEKVAALKTVDDSVKALLVSLKAKLDELAARETIDPAEVAAIAADIGAETDGLSAAVVANTPSA